MPAPEALTIRAAEPADRLPLYRMLELYQHDLSDIWNQELDAHGEYGYALDRYFARHTRCRAYIAQVAGHLAGFALVDTEVKVGPGGHWMDQFFVLKKYRRTGLGRTLAWATFDALPGTWEVGQMPANQPAQTFWRCVIGEYTQQRGCPPYQEHRLTSGWWQGVVQRFQAPSLASPAAHPSAPA